MMSHVQYRGNMKKTLPQVLDVCIFSYFRYLLIRNVLPKVIELGMELTC